MTTRRWLGRVAPQALALAAVLVATARGQEAPRGLKVFKTDAQWRKQLTPAQYYVTRAKGTEAPWSGKYAKGHYKGAFACVGCDAPLFDAKTKFSSGTGWPSFYRPIRPEAVATAPDNSSGEARVEVMCADCGAHLGHVFADGPAPTGLRYCMNSVALKLVPPKPDAKAIAKPEAAAEDEAGAAPEGDGPAEPAAAKPKAATPKAKMSGPASRAATSRSSAKADATPKARKG